MKKFFMHVCGEIEDLAAEIDEKRLRERERKKKRSIGLI